MKKFSFVVLALLGMSTVFFHSCVKKRYDNPPDTTTIDPNLPVNKTIWDLKQLYVANGGVNPYEIVDDFTIYGVVVADDRGGNYYKQIVIQDSTTGIPVLLSKNGLYNEYPVGRKVYIKCKGLYLGSYGNLIQLGAQPDATGSLTEIPSSLISKYVVKANFDLSQVVPKVVSISDLKNINGNLKLLSTLIQLDSVEFIGSDCGIEYADAPTLSSASERTVEDCAGNNVVLRTSGYSYFRTTLTPSGRGKLLAIYSRYNSTAQLSIRDTSDVAMGGPRCNANASLYTIRQIRDMYTGTSMTVGAGYKVKGIVISDKANKNINAQNIALQDATGGIVLRFESGATLPSLNDEVEVFISGGSLSMFNGVLQVSNLNSSNITKTGTGSVIPRVATIRQLLDSLDVWESTLVKINNAVFTSTGTYNGNRKIVDAATTDTITHFAFSAATFSAATVPTTPVSLTGILGEYTTATSTTKQISVRTTTDVQ
jgi:DNA/RNA endonuclease YhcR with UshA esterase domain